jgi:hypothetical protein
LAILSANAIHVAGIQDVAGNALDGEFYGKFPSGNNIPGGNFVALVDAIHNKIFPPQPLTSTSPPPNLLLVTPSSVATVHDVALDHLASQKHRKAH